MSVKGTGTGRFRMNLAGQHMIAADLFSRNVLRLETEHAGKQFDNFFNEIISYTTGCILSSVAALEANINELFFDADVNFSFSNSELYLLKEIWVLIERKEILEKYQSALKLKKKEPLKKGNATFQNVKDLIKLRNAVMHFKPEWQDEQDDHKTIEQALNGKFKLSPFITNGPFFPQKCMSHGCTEWVVNTVLAFEREFATAFGAEARLAKFSRRS